jgi:hypothetical protein
VCYAPAAAPRIAVAVIVENGEHGSSAAGPISRELVKAYLRRPPGGQKVAGEDIRVVLQKTGDTQPAAVAAAALSGAHPRPQ